jgi:Uncharacterized conserved protein
LGGGACIAGVLFFGWHAWRAAHKPAWGHQHASSGSEQFSV